MASPVTRTTHLLDSTTNVSIVIPINTVQQDRQDFFRKTNMIPLYYHLFIVKRTDLDSGKKDVSQGEQEVASTGLSIPSVFWWQIWLSLQRWYWKKKQSHLHVAAQQPAPVLFFWESTNHFKQLLSDCTVNRGLIPLWFSWQQSIGLCLQKHTQLHQRHLNPLYPVKHRLHAQAHGLWFLVTYVWGQQRLLPGLGEEESKEWE